ncbi:MAG: phospholipid carrier-dependent glycosyltransferase [bacterium]|nr:phospholipid carrier-dependent glycosyltransferase [bacterium]
MKNKIIYLIVALFIIQVALYLFMIKYRFVDANIGGFLTAIRLISEGGIPYIDFAYMHMPLFIYGAFAWSKVFGFSLFNLRFFSALFSILLGLAITYYAWKKSDDKRIALIVFFLYAFSGAWISLTTTFQTQPISSFFSFLAFLFITRVDRKQRLTYIFLAGLCIGIAANVRSVFILAFPIIFLYIIAIDYKKIKLSAKRVASLFCGFLIPSIPTLLFIAKGAEHFFYNTLLLHQHATAQPLANLGGPITTASFIGVFLQRYKAAFVFLSDPQTLIVFLLFAASMILLIHRLMKKRSFVNAREQLLLLGLLLVLSIAYLLPRYTYVEWFVQIIPFMIVLSIPFIDKILSSYKFSKKNFVNIIIIVSLLFYFAVGPPYYIFKNVNEIGGLEPEFGVSNVHAVVNEIESITSEEDLVLTWWSGYTALANRHVVHGLEAGIFSYTPASRTVLNRISDEKARKFNIITEEETFDIINNKKVKVIIVDLTCPEEFKDAIEANYILHKEISETKIFVSEER